VSVADTTFDTERFERTQERILCALVSFSGNDRKEKIMKKTVALMVAFIAGVLVFLPSVSSAESGTKPVVVQDSNPCLVAPNRKTYTLCFALWNQPSYDWEQPDGSVIGVPESSEIIAELSEEGITPDGSPGRFRRAARALIGEYFEHVER
jgi:hypothetical protein